MDTSAFYRFRDDVVNYAAYCLNRALDPRRFSVAAQNYDPNRYASALVFFNPSIQPALRLRVYLQLGDQVFIPADSFRLYEDPNNPPSPDDEVYVLDAVVTPDILQQWTMIREELLGYLQEDYLMVDPITALITHDGYYITYA